MSNQFDQQPPQSYYNGAQNNPQYSASGQQQWNGQYGQYGQNAPVNNAVPAYARPQYNQYQQDSFLQRWLVRSLIIRLVVYGIFLLVALGVCGFFAFAVMLSH